MPPQVSVYIPVRNRPGLLAETLRALQAQTFHDWDCWVIDDASTDHTGDVIRDFEREDDRFHGVRRSTAGGDAAAGNTGLEHLRGRYAARMDSDDLPLPTWLQASMDFAQRFDGVGFGCQAEWFGEASDMAPGKPKETDPARWRAWSLFNLEIVHSGLVFRRDIQQRERVLYGAVAMNNDWDFVSRLSDHGAFANLPSVQVRVRRHGGNASRADHVVEDRHSTSVAIRRRMLVSRLGIEPTDEEMVLHCTAHHAPYWSFADQAYVWFRHQDYPDRLAAWAQRLIQANDARGWPFDPGVLRSVLLDEVVATAVARWRALPAVPPSRFRMTWLPDDDAARQTPP